MKTVIGRLQDTWPPGWLTEAGWVLDGSDFPKQGRNAPPGNVLREAGQGGQLRQGGMFLAYVSPLGRALVDLFKAGWVAGDDAFGMSPTFRESLAGLGMRYVTFRAALRSGPWSLRGTRPGPLRGLSLGSGAPASPGLPAVTSCRMRTGGR